MEVDPSGRLQYTLRCIMWVCYIVAALMMPVLIDAFTGYMWRREFFNETSRRWFGRPYGGNWHRNLRTRRWVELDLEMQLRLQD
jgi:hypothetical protein